MVDPEKAIAAEGESAASGSSLRDLLGLPGRPGWRGELWILAFFALATIVLTWPIAIDLPTGTGIRGDYYNNLWNAWWVRHSIVEGHSPYWTDYLYFPEGISLRRHTLSLLNSLSGALLGAFLDQDAAFNLILLAHFALSAWAFSLFARYVTGSTAGGVLGGLVYSFCPFHYYYLCQINVFTFEFIPLALLFFVKYYREGGRGNLIAVALALAGMAASVEYYVVYTYMVVGLLLFCASSWAPEVPRRQGLARVLVAGALGAGVVAIVALPLLYGTLGPERGIEIGTAAYSVEKHRVNDLFGFYWVGGREECFVSWPTMIGYGTLVLIALGIRQVLRVWPWMLVGVVFFVLSLGEKLSVGGEDTGIPMPYAVFRVVPVLSMLRKSDRCFMIVELIAALAVAAAWAGVAHRLRAGGPRRMAWIVAALLLMVELTGVPFGRYETKASPYLAELARDASVTAVMDLPPMNIHVANGRYDYYQTLHGKKSTLGYTTSLAVTARHDERVETLSNLYLQFILGANRALPRKAQDLGVDLALHYHTWRGVREKDASIDGKTLWKPFFFERRPLVRIRQLGEYVDVRYEDADWDAIRLAFSRAFGPPIHEDPELMAFRVAE